MIFKVPNAPPCAHGYFFARLKSFVSMRLLRFRMCFFLSVGKKKIERQITEMLLSNRSLLEIVTEIQLSTMRWLRQSMHVIFDFNQSNGLITYLWEWKCTAAFKVVNLTSIYRITPWIPLFASYDWPAWWAISQALFTQSTTEKWNTQKLVPAMT